MAEEWIGYPAEDGKRYTVGKAKPNDPKTFIDFYESDELDKAKERCIGGAEKDGLEYILWDRKYGGMIFRHKTSEGAEDDKPRTITTTRKTRKRSTTKPNDS